MDASHPQGYDQSHAVPSGAWDSDSSVVADQVDHRGWAQHQQHAQLQQVHHQQQLMQQHGAYDAANTWTQAPAHHGAAPVMYSPMPTPNFETPQFAHPNHQSYHHSWPHPSMHATPSYGHPGAYTPHGMCATPSAYAPYAPPPPTPQADANAPMQAEYNEPERRETSDGRFWTARAHRHCLRRYLTFLQRVKQGAVQIGHVRDTENPSDFLTKFVSKEKVAASVKFATNHPNAVTV